MTGELLHEADSDLHRFTKSLFFPMLLLLNFAIFQYLVLLFHVRDQEKRVLLLLASCVSVAALVPCTMQDEDTTTALVGTKHVKGPGANVSRPLMYFADLLILFECDVVVLGIICMFRPRIAAEFGGTDVINNVSENLMLAFMLLFQFIGLSKDKGWRQTVRDDKWELVFHVVFMMHEYPFMLLENETYISWEYIQAIFMRLALTPCMSMTIGKHHHRQFWHQQKATSILELRRLSANSLKQLTQVTTTMVDERGDTKSKSAAVVYAAKEDNDAELKHAELQPTAEAAIDDKQPPLNGAPDASKDNASKTDSTG